MARRAVLLTGSLGLGHDMPAHCCARLLERCGWQTRYLNAMSMLGERGCAIGERVFGAMLAVPGLYDGLHFAHLRTGSRIARMLEAMSSARLVPALHAELERDPADMLLSLFPTGATAAARVKPAFGGMRAVVLCPDVGVHRLWAADGTDLFLVSSSAAAASVRRFLPRARVEIIPRPVRPEFYAAPAREAARKALEIPVDARCALLIDSGWGRGQLTGIVTALAKAGVHVLAVAGRHRTVEERYLGLARVLDLVYPFGFTARVPELMAAADVVLALPGASTCAEARVVGRPLLLLDLMPGHGRDNLLHELELGEAAVCGPTPAEVADAALALLDGCLGPGGAGAQGARPPAPRWEPAFADALRGIGIVLDDHKLREAGQDDDAHLVP